MGYRTNKREEFVGQAKEKQVVCFGTGKIFYEFLEFADSVNIDVFYACDNNREKWGQVVERNGRKIIIDSPEKLMEDIFQNAIIIITCTQIRDVYQQLQEMHIKEENIYVFPFVTDAIGDERKMYQRRIAGPARTMLDKYLQDFQVSSEQREDYVRKVESLLEQECLVMPYMTFLATSKCSLRCRDCSNLMPFCNGGRTLGMEQILSDIRAIGKAVECCICVNITGGEPFLHPDFGRILKEVTSYDIFLFVEVITNGTIIPRPEWKEYLSHPKVMVKVSEYYEYSRTDEIEDYFKKNNIRFQIRPDLQWVTSGGILRRNKQYEEIMNEYLRCWSGKYCKSIWDGKLFACARAAFLHDIKASNHMSDYIELHSEELEKRIMKHMLSPYVDACDFCDHMNPRGKKIKAAIQEAVSS